MSTAPPIDESQSVAGGQAGSPGTVRGPAATSVSSATWMSTYHSPCGPFHHGTAGVGVVDMATLPSSVRIVTPKPIRLVQVPPPRLGSDAGHRPEVRVLDRANARVA